MKTSSFIIVAIFLAVALVSLSIEVMGQDEVSCLGQRIIDLCEENYKLTEDISAVAKEEERELILYVNEIKDVLETGGHIAGRNDYYLIRILLMNKQNNDGYYMYPVYYSTGQYQDQALLEQVKIIFNLVSARNLLVLPQGVFYKLLSMLVKRGIYQEEYPLWLEDVEKRNLALKDLYKKINQR